jgi:hypothetical protein
MSQPGSPALIHPAELVNTCCCCHKCRHLLRHTPGCGHCCVAGTAAASLCSCCGRRLYVRSRLQSRSLPCQSSRAPCKSSSSKGPLPGFCTLLAPCAGAASAAACSHQAALSSCWQLQSMIRCDGSCYCLCCTSQAVQLLCEVREQHMGLHRATTAKTAATRTVNTQHQAIITAQPTPWSIDKIPAASLQVRIRSRTATGHLVILLWGYVSSSQLR